MERNSEIVEQWDQWLPPEPHRAAVVEFVTRGRASIVQPDADRPPLLMYEDGGAMELPLVRCDGQEPFYLAGRPAEQADGGDRSTKYSDVCGSIDEFKRHVTEGAKALAERRGEIAELFDDIRHMIGRMYRRQREYTAFADRLRAIIEELAAVEIVDRAPADEGLAELELMLDGGEELGAAERLNELAEQVRAVASAQEQRLRDHKNAALAALAAYREAKGSRDWSKDEEAEG